MLEQETRLLAIRIYSYLLTSITNILKDNLNK